MRENHNNIKTTFEKMCDQFQRFGATTVCFAATRSKKVIPSLRKLQLSDSVSDDFRGIAIQTQRKYLSTRRNVHYEFKSYTAESKPDDHEIEYLDLSECPDIARQIALLKSLADIDVGLSLGAPGFRQECVTGTALIPASSPEGFVCRARARYISYQIVENHQCIRCSSS